MVNIFDPAPTVPPQPSSGFPDIFAPSGPATGPILDPGQIQRLVREYAGQYGIPESLALAIVRQESGFNPRAVSSANARGLTQLMPGTARAEGVSNPFDVRQSLSGGFNHLRALYRKYGSWALALAAYNSGESAVDRYKGIPPFAETQRYVRAIMSASGLPSEVTPAGTAFRGSASSSGVNIFAPAPSAPSSGVDIFAPAQAPSAPAPTTAPATPGTPARSGPLGFGERLLGGAWSGLKAGVDNVFRALRIPQEVVVSASLKFVLDHNRAPSLNDLMNAAKDAVGKDESPSQILKEHGVIHPGVVGTIEGLLTDTAADPLWFVTPAKVASLLRIPRMIEAARAAKPVAALLDHPAVQRVARAVLHPDIGKPAPFLQRSATFETDVRTAALDAQAFGRRIQKVLSPEEDAILRKYIEPPAEFRPTRNPNNLKSARDAVLADARKKGLNVDKIQALGEEAIQRGLKNDEEMLRLGIIDQETFDRWAGEHVRRDYQKHANRTQYMKNLSVTNPEASALADAAVKTRAGMAGKTYPIAERLEFLSKRQDIPEDVRKVMGEIPQASYSIAKGEYLATRSVTVRKFLQDTADTWGRDAFERGYKRIPESDRFGPLASKWVPEAIAEQLIPAFGEKTISLPWLRTMTRWFKVGKIGLNPAAHARIIIHNAFLADVAGLGIFKSHRYGQALREIISRGEKFQEAERGGLFTGSLFAHDIFGDLLKGIGGVGEDLNTTQALTHGLERYFGTVGKVLGTPVRMANHAMEFEDRLFKLAYYLDRRAGGASIEEAAKAANTALLNYAKVPSLVRNLSQYGVVPFISFPFQATQRIAQAVYTHPASLSKYGKLFKTVEDLGGPSSQVENEKTLFPPWMRLRREGFIRLPVKDSQGRDLFFDAGYLLPTWIPSENINAIRDLFAPPTVPGQKEDTNLLTGNMVGNLVQFGIWGSLTQGLILGIDPLTGKKLAGTTPKLFATRPEEDPLLARLDWLYRFAAPVILGTSAEQVRKAIDQAPSSALAKTSIPRAVPEAILRYGAGLHVEHLDPVMSRAYALKALQAEILDIKKDLKRIASSQYYLAHLDERDAAIKEDLDRIRVVVAQISNVSDMNLPSDGVPPTEPIATPRGYEAPFGSSSRGDVGKNLSPWWQGVPKR